jgi:cytochrome P450
LFGADLDERDAADLRRAISALAAGDPLASLLAPARRTRAARERLHAIAGSMIERRLASGAPGEDLFALLLSAQPIGDAEAAKQLHDDVLTFLAAGYDTIASTLTWSWLMLSQHPDVEEALHRELADVLRGELPAAGDVVRLTYTRAVLAECLRLFPAAWMLTRVAIADCELDTDTIRAGTLVVMSPYLVHRDPRFFAEPLAFDPSRWLSTERPARPKLAYFPFGAGPRSCIGEGFALMEGTLALAVLAQRWKIRAIGPPAVVVDARVTLRPKPPVMARVEARA